MQFRREYCARAQKCLGSGETCFIPTEFSFLVANLRIMQRSGGMAWLVHVQKASLLSWTALIGRRVLLEQIRMSFIPGAINPHCYPRLLQLDAASHANSIWKNRYPRNLLILLFLHFILASRTSIKFVFTCRPHQGRMPPHALFFPKPPFLVRHQTIITGSNYWHGKEKWTQDGGHICTSRSSRYRIVEYTPGLQATAISFRPQEAVNRAVF